MLEFLKDPLRNKGYGLEGKDLSNVHTLLGYMHLQNKEYLASND